MKESDKCLDSQLWHACAGTMVQMPALGSLVYYFPQGHAEHAQGYVDFGSCPRIPPYVLCRVSGIKYMADADTDEVFAKMSLVPVRPSEMGYYSRDEGGALGSNGSDAPEKPASFAKTLTQSDANNGGGFSVPRYCAETIFPRLDYPLMPSSNPLCRPPDGTGGAPAGIQGARHAQFCSPLSDFRVNKLHSDLRHSAGFHRLDQHAASDPRISTDLIIGTSPRHDNVSCLLIGANSSSAKRPPFDSRTPQFLLFGQPILTEQQISLSSGETAASSPLRTEQNVASDGNAADKTADLSDGSGDETNRRGPTDDSSCEAGSFVKDRRAAELGLETGHCKVFMQSENVGRTLDLSRLGSYEELHRRLADMFGIDDKSNLLSHVLYRDASGAVKHTGSEPFGDFMKTARRLQIQMDLGTAT